MWCIPWVDWYLKFVVAFPLPTRTRRAHTSLRRRPKHKRANYACVFATIFKDDKTIPATRVNLPPTE
jgi:hypothetical protein